MLIFKNFTTERRVRQGDSLSPYLSVTAVEILVIVVRNKDSGIKEIEINGLETKLLQFADHTFYWVYSPVTPFLVYLKSLRRPLV